MFDEDARTALIKHLGYSQTPLATPCQEQQEEEEEKEVVEQVEEVQQPAMEQMPSVDAITAEDLFASASPLAALPPKVVEEKVEAEEAPVTPMMVEKEMVEVDPAFERALKDRVVVGDFEGAVEICFQFGRFTDALVIAAWSGPELVEQATVGIE